MGFTAHSGAFEQPGRGQVADIADSPNPVEFEIGKEIVQQPGDGFSAIALAVIDASQGEADFGLLAILQQDAKSAIANYLARIFQGNGKLIPLPRSTWPGLF